MDKRIIANIKSLAIDMINEAKSGHPGIALDSAAIMYTIFAKHLNYNPTDSNWIGRDRFVLSAGHGSALLYATMFMAGYDLTIDDLKSFRKLNSKTPGHPEYGKTVGVEATTGPLGQGIANAVGMALGGKILKEKYQDKNKSLIDYSVYVLCSDGDLMEGISYEACSLAGTLNLDNLILLYDANGISLDGDISNTFTENISKRFEAMGFYTDFVRNGEDVDAIDRAIDKAKRSGKPSLIEIKTIIGNGSLIEGTNEVHGKNLTSEDIKQLKVKLNVSLEPFFVDNEARSNFRKQLSDRSLVKYEIWSRNYQEYLDQGKDLKYLFNTPTSDLSSINWEIDPEAKEATRISNGKIMNKLAAIVPNFIGGSADLTSSTKTYLKEFGDIKDNHYDGRNIWFGVREHAMGGILNGLALTKFIPFGSTFLSFADYMKPAIRLSALMHLPVTYIFTHDSINIGEDGPTHQPVEQLAMLRSIPNLKVYRPADAKEIIGCWNLILNSNNNPSALILSRAEVSLLDNTNVKEVSKGAYIIREANEHLNGILIATGKEVETAYHVAMSLYKQHGIDLRVISMPSMEVFNEQDDTYKKALLPDGYKVIAIEAGSSFGWEKFVYNNNYLININTFGLSASKDDVLTEMNFSYQQIENRIIKLIK